MNPEDINSLAARAKAGDKASEKLLFEQLRARFQLILHHSLQNRDDIEDLTQEALAAVARDYPTTEFRESFSGWCAQVLRNRLLMHFRTRNQERKRTSSVEIAGLNDSGNDINPELAATLAECMRKICFVNKRYARILALSFQGYRIEEICGRLKITATNAYSILSRARSALASCLDAGGNR